MAIGDDAAVMLPSELALLATTDTLTEDVHFTIGAAAPYSLGRKSLNVSLSDIAAMGGRPLFFLISIAAPGATDMDFIDELYKGIMDAAGEAGVGLVGGNTSMSPEKITLATTVIGEAPEDEVLYRSGARDGDAVYVTGTLGDSALGLRVLGGAHKKLRRVAAYDDAVSRHIDPEPRLVAGRVVAEKKLATAMTDISDGLVADLRHITEASKVGAEIEIERLPISAALERYIESDPSGLDLALSGGEDYELLLTVSEDKIEELETVKGELGVAITRIGRIVPAKAGLRIVDAGGNTIEHGGEGYDHFGR